VDGENIGHALLVPAQVSIPAPARSRAEECRWRLIDPIDAPPEKNFVYDVFQGPRTFLKFADGSLVEESRPFIVGEGAGNAARTTCQKTVNLNPQRQPPVIF
jgi:hypothetical protein